MLTMLEWINSVLVSPDLNFVMLPALMLPALMLLALMLLGAISAVGSCCNIAVIGALSGYAIAKENKKYIDIFIVTVSFMLGTVLALVVIGAVIGYAGQVAGDNFGRYSKVLAGFVSVFFGLFALNLVPINKLKLPEFSQLSRKFPGGLLGTAVFGFALGGSSLSCSVSCGPGLAVVLGVASLQGQVIKSAMLMGAYAIGYSLPLCAILLGVSFGGWTLRANKIMPAIRIVAGVLLLAIGFYLLATI